MKSKYGNTNNEPFPGGIDPPAHRPETRYINVKGRKEHEALLKDPAKCKELGLDLMFETMVYLKRWGGWLEDGEE